MSITSKNVAIIIFVRHGHSTKNELGILNGDIDGFPLTHKGILETKKTAEELSKLHISKIYTGPILRAVQTAEIIGDVLDIKPRVDNRLTDRGPGEMRNKPTKDGDWLLDVDWKHSSVEPMPKVKERIKSFVDSIANVNGIYVVVTHDTPIKAVFMDIFKMEDIMENGLKIRNSSMSIISTKNGWTPISMNYMELPDFLVDKISATL
jgi:2,3-bisphosphoglycerate-dependent phosphoglycerate mutase